MFPDRRYFVTGPMFPVNWFHTAVVVHGPDTGASVYMNGSPAVADTTEYNGTYTTGSSEIGIGKLYLNDDRFHSTVEVDELIIWNRSLNETEVYNVYRTYWNISHGCQGSALQKLHDFQINIFSIGWIWKFLKIIKMAIFDKFRQRYYHILQHSFTSVDLFFNQWDSLSVLEFIILQFVLVWTIFHNILLLIFLT